MKGILAIAVTTAFMQSVSCDLHLVGHGRRHAKKNQHGVGLLKSRETMTVTNVVPGPVHVEYILDGHEINASEAVKGIEQGIYVVVGDSAPQSASRPPTNMSTTSSMDGRLFEQITTISSSSSSTSAPPESTRAPAPLTPPSPPAPPLHALPPALPLGPLPPALPLHPLPPAPPLLPLPPRPLLSPSPEPVPAQPAAPPATTAGIDVEFPSGKLKCSDGVPTAYGAIEVGWLGTSGWTGIQDTGGWTNGVLINHLVTATQGGCPRLAFCSYACPAGYQKTQWPENSQGAAGQSIGGLYCNDDGYLELTRPSQPKLCEPGAGGVYVENRLGGNVAVCRTDYPGSEDMVVPLDTQPGQTYPLTNVDSSSYYKWKGMATTAQYYVNPMGVSVQDACCWKSITNPFDAGNWAPINMGVGRDSLGITYISIFPNAPTTTAKLDYNIEITGDVNSKCWYRNGVYAGGSHGCTVSVVSQLAMTMQPS